MKNANRTDIQKHNFKKLHVWQEALDFCDAVYNYTDGLPSKERHNLCDQLEKCAVSIPANISEGSSKRTNVHFSEFITTALGSSYEAQTHLLICQRRKYGNQIMLETLLIDVEKLQGRIFNFRDTILGHSK